MFARLEDDLQLGSYVEVGAQLLGCWPAESQDAAMLPLCPKRALHACTGFTCVFTAAPLHCLCSATCRCTVRLEVRHHLSAPAAALVPRSPPQSLPSWS